MPRQEKEVLTSDEQIVRFLEPIVESPLYYKFMAGVHDAAQIISTADLTPDAVDTLLGQRFLAVRPYKTEPRIEESMTNIACVTNLPFVEVQVIGDGAGGYFPNTADIFLAVDVGSNEYAAPDTHPYIDDIRERVTQRRKGIKERRQLQTATQKGVTRELRRFPFLRLTPALHSLQKTIVYNHYVQNRPLTSERVADITRDLRLRAQDERSLPLPTVGCEVEIPTFSAWENSGNEPAWFVSFMENQDLLHALGIPTETDEQGEVALPKSKDAGLQVDLLQQLHEGGFLPVNARTETQLLYSLHVNLGIPPAYGEVWKATDYRGGRDSKPSDHSTVFFREELTRLATYLGIAFSSPERIQDGDYSDSAQLHFKNKKRDQDVVEVRNLLYDPHRRDTKAVLKDIQLILFGFIHALSHSGDTTIRGHYLRMLELCDDDINSGLGWQAVELVQQGNKKMAAKAAKKWLTHEGIRSTLSSFAAVVEERVTTKNSYIGS